MCDLVPTRPLDRAGHFEIPLRLLGHPVPAAQTGGGRAVPAAARRPLLPGVRRLHLPVVSPPRTPQERPRTVDVGVEPVGRRPSRGQCSLCVRRAGRHERGLGGAPPQLQGVLRHFAIFSSVYVKL